MGTVRSIKDYEKYAGIKFKDQTVSIYTLSGKLAPTPNDQNYVCGKTSDVAEIKSISKSISVDSNKLTNDDVSYINLEVYDTNHTLMVTQSFDKKYLSIIGKNINPITISVNFDVMIETNYYCKLYIFDFFDRVISEIKISI